MMKCISLDTFKLKPCMGKIFIKMVKLSMIALTTHHQALQVAKYLKFGMDFLQPHFGVLQDKPLGILVNKDFVPIDLQSPEVVGLAKYLGLPHLDPKMKLDEFRRLIQNAATFEDKRLEELFPVVDWILSADRNSTCALTDLIGFVSGATFLNKWNLEIAPIYDSECKVAGSARFYLDVEVLQDCGDYDEFTGEAYYFHGQFSSCFHSDNLEKILSSVGELAESAIETLNKEKMEDHCFLRRACVYEEGETIISINFEMTDDNYITVNHQGLTGYKMLKEDIWVKDPDRHVLDAIRNVFGNAAYQGALERKFGADLGL